jgi:hypothetical protein
LPDFLTPEDTVGFFAADDPPQATVNDTRCDHWYSAALWPTA